MPPTPPESPDAAFLDISLSGSPYQLYTPGSKVNGSVIFSGRVEDAVIEIEFVGLNKSKIVDQCEKLGTGSESFTDEVMLFQYNQVLHGIGQHQYERFRPSDDTWNRASSWPFCFRFPSVTEARRTVCYRDISPGGWTNYRHSLPPSFDYATEVEDMSLCTYLQSSKFNEDYSECKVEYALIAKISIPGRKPKVLKLPIQFMPFGPPSSILPHSLSMSLDHFAAPSEAHVDVTLAGPPSTWGLIATLAIHPPAKIKIGHTFTVSGMLTISSHHLLQSDVSASSIQIAVTNLHLVCRTVWRAKRCAKDDRRPSYGAPPNERQQEEQHTYSLAHTDVDITLDRSSNAVGFSFDAGRQSHLSPSFASFLVANSYDLRGTVIVSIRGDYQTLSFEAHEIPVVSSIQPPITGIRHMQLSAQRRFSSIN